MKQLNIQIEDDQHEWLRQKAFRERVSMAQVVREIINKSMKEESEKSEILANRLLQNPELDSHEIHSRQICTGGNQEGEGKTYCRRTGSNRGRI